MFLISNNCADCGSSQVHILMEYLTKNNGFRNLYICEDCKTIYSETKNTFMENMKKPISKIATVLEARTEGLGFNATCRTFHISPSTLSSWENKFSDLKNTLCLYALTNAFLSQTIEGDELYTKVNSNKSPAESEGWTIMLLERRSRFIWELSCNKKDEKLFRTAIETLADVIKITDDISLVTDGERRYGNILFEICRELLYTGKRGRPKSVLPKGVKVRVKNKGNQSHKRGPKRKKYQSPISEHPDTKQNIKNNEIHANHCEGQNSAMRRKNSAYRRETNTYAKNNGSLQRTLDLYWVVHNYIRVHFSIKTVPAVALGVIEKAMSWSDIFHVRTKAKI
jgi:hypothetical protein